MSWRERISKVLAGRLGGPHEGGIMAYHSSPHDFDRFDLSKLRTGEGANVYGSGFYFAENPAVSGRGGQYWNTFKGRFMPDEKAAAEALQSAGFNREAAVATSQAHIDALKAQIARGGKYPEYWVGELARRQAQHELLASGSGPVGPRTYEVNIKAKPEELLDWDKPLKQQPQVVRDFLESVPKNQWGHGPLDRFIGERGGVEGATGADIYKNLGFWGRVEPGEVSQELRAAGIPGIRYLDQGSRFNTGNDISILQNQLKATQALHDTTPTAYTTKELGRLQSLIDRTPPPSYNYVAFDPSRLDIMAKYGLPFAAGATGLGAVADQSAYAAAPDTFDQRWGQR